MMNEAITAGIPTVKKNGMIGTNPPMAVETRGGNRGSPRVGKVLLREPELLVHERAEKLLRLLLELLGHRVRFLGREPFQLVEQLELEQLLVRVLFDFRALARHFRLVDLAGRTSTPGTRRRPSTARWPACRPARRPARLRCRRCSRPCRRRSRTPRRDRRSRRRWRRRSSRCRGRATVRGGGWYRAPNAASASRRRRGCAGPPRGRALRASPLRRSGGRSGRCSRASNCSYSASARVSSCSSRCSTTAGSPRRWNQDSPRSTSVAIRALDRSRA